MSNDTVLEVKNLQKTYRLGFRRKAVHAVRDISFDVKKGEIFGFIGPNGAGKTTTIRMAMGLVQPTAGDCYVFGHRVPSREARQRLGFLPEHPYFHDYLTSGEMLDLMGRLHGLDQSARKRKTDELLERVGMSHAKNRPMRKYSKGMLQRAGLAQALINDPELIVLDEPMSGLDPIGRKEVRDIILELRDSGKTVFFSTHILPDVEAICDRVAVIANGKVHDVGTVRELLGNEPLGTDLIFHAEKPQVLCDVLPEGIEVRTVQHDVILHCGPTINVDALLKMALPHGELMSFSQRRHSLEELFVKRAQEEKRPEERG